jgi:hypothetical protein
MNDVPSNLVLSLSTSLPPCVCAAVFDALGIYSSFASHLSNPLSYNLLSQMKLCNAIQAINICFCHLVEKLDIAFNMRHFCLRTPNDRSMPLRRDECKRLNISCFPCD